MRDRIAALLLPALLLLLLAPSMAGAQETYKMLMYQRAGLVPEEQPYFEWDITASCPCTAYCPCTFYWGYVPFEAGDPFGAVDIIDTPAQLGDYSIFDDGSLTRGGWQMQTERIDTAPGDPARYLAWFLMGPSGCCNPNNIGDLANPKLKSFRQTSTMKPLMDQFLVLSGTGEVGEVGVAAGQPAVPITSSAGTTWVATTGKPYVLQITSAPETGEDATVDFKDWNKKVVIKAPPKKQTISLADLA